MSKLTNERLRSWLNGDQPSRERMCLALLKTVNNYSEVEPRRPEGGPDGGRDLQVLYKGGHVVWGAIGFRNSAKDSDEDKSWVKKKFEEDLVTARSRNPSLWGFVFFTNVDLTPNEVEKLRSFAHDKGVAVPDIFYRERLMILLDAPDGLAIRFDYLGVKLSLADQTAFFTRFGTGIDKQFQQQLQGIENYFARLELLQTMDLPIRNFEIAMTLHGPTSLADFCPYQICFETMSFCREKRKSYKITAIDAKFARKSTYRGSGIKIQKGDSNDSIVEYTGHLDHPISVLSIRCWDLQPVSWFTPRFLDQVFLIMHVSERLVSKLARMDLIINGLIINSRSCHDWEPGYTTYRPPSTSFYRPLHRREKLMTLVQLDVSDSLTRIDFNRLLPERQLPLRNVRKEKLPADF